ncbi:hypothetical protein LWI29_020534 [Acer saccharum]|uniref:Uncharacterized protein n=1 Tax=Acer saccharum TaxID=4024 RepID=A0AA39T431_ACESA|nr:hypothetical protein LWI29_020534 [Acer saccharum]
MAFLISKAETSSFSNSSAQKMNLMNHSKEDHTHTTDNKESLISPVSTQLLLRSSAAADKNAVLRRIRHHKCLYKVKSAFEGLVSSSNNNNEQKWLEQYDAFSSP